MPPAVSEPVFKVIMPPLRFDASSPDPPSEASTETIFLVRTAVVHGEIIYRGSVAEGKRHESKLVTSQANASVAPPPTDSGVLAKIGGFFRKLFGGKA